MNTTKRISITLDLPEELYERASLKAAREQRHVSEVLNATLEEGLIAPETARELWEELSVKYRARLDREGKLHQTDEEVWTEMARIRQEVADELYPEIPNSPLVASQ